ncbi:PDDEXK family nuclease [Bacillus pacificus]|uniref:hypothetical protein n=1 Tax=Bacillus pacificus TaxID=2026187 RepID=UPI0021D36767|nr:hypothetical protein [Bacillus pacificus]MCU5068334.1 hypothetical protein [Bacillus pacificus]
MDKKANWELFEVESCNYLNTLYGGSSITFQVDGGKNSSSSDIKVFNRDKYLFSIEAKYSPSQSGQFVLVENDNLYSLSPVSKFENNEYTQAIIDYLNENKGYYSPKGQKAIEISIDKKVLAQWITEHYQRKDSHFVITSTKLYDYKALLPINVIKDFFEVSAVVRRKKSGTADVAQYKIETSINELKEYLKQHSLAVTEVVPQGKKTLIKLNRKVDLKKSDRYFGECYFLSPNSKGEGYYIKQRSKTNNLNVIFSLVYTGPEKNSGIELLRKFINSLC